MKPNLPYDRAARLADQIYRVVSEICYTELSDPRLEGVQITQVRMTKDLRTARVFFHSTAERAQGIKKALVSAKGFFKRAIKETIPLKYMPEFEFFYDDTVDVRDHIEEIFAGLENK